MDLKTDQQLVLAIQLGDVASFAVFVGRYQKRLLAFVYHLIRDHHLAEEIVQDSLFAFYQTIERVDVAKNISSYIYVITRNTTYSALRKRKLHVSLDDEIVGETDMLLYDHLYQEEEKQQIKTAIQRLELKYRQVINLYYFADLSYEEISHKLKIPINTVRTHLGRGKEHLKQLLHHEKH